MKKCKKCGLQQSIENYYRKGEGKRRSICIVCYRDHRKISEHKPESRYKKYLRDAMRRELAFELTREQFFNFNGKPCRYCGTVVIPISLDRIDNSKGYLAENVDACCSNCNSLKHIFGEADFLKHIKKIYNYQVGRKDGKQENLSQEVSKKYIINQEGS